MNKQQIINRCDHLKRDIDKCEKALYDYDELTKLATMCLAQNAISFFKACKFQTYYQNVHQFTSTEIDNCEKTIELFNRVIGLNTTLIQKDVRHWEQHDRRESSRIIEFKDYNEEDQQS